MKHAMTTAASVRGTCTQVVMVVTIVTLAMPSISAGYEAPRSGGPGADGEVFEVRYTATFSENALRFGRSMGYDTVSLEGADWLNEPGKPLLPAQTVRIALPAAMAVTDVRVVATEPVNLAGEYVIFPAQPPRPISDPASPHAFVPPDPQTYASTEPYPAQAVRFVLQSDLAGQGIAEILLCPLHYLPRERRVVLHRSIDLVIEGVGGYECGDYLPESTSARRREAYEQAVEDMVVNPEDVELRSSGGAPPPRGVTPGDYDYVIITQASWVDDFEDLAYWKTKKGAHATIVTTEWIFSEYSGSTDPDKIQAFVADAHSTWGATFFLLGGDTNIVPHATKHYELTLGGELKIIDAPSDSYYGDYDQDFLCEVHVGRACVRASGHISTFIDKILTYEQSPPGGDAYPLKASLFGFDLDGSTHGENLKTYIDSTYIPATWTMRNVYDSDPTPPTHQQSVKDAVNDGQNLINHIDHGNTYSMSVGDGSLSTGEVDAFYNGDRQSILYTMACHVAAFDEYACIAEHFVQNPNGGCIGFVGNSRYGIYSPGNTSSLSCRYDREFFEAMFDEGHYVLGEAFSDSKNEGPHSDNYYRCIFDELNLLGDPELPVWTGMPGGLDVAHDETRWLAQTSSMLVEVYSAGSPVQDALVCLWKDAEVYLTGHTGPTGTVGLDPVPESTGMIWVTATRHNYLPYEGYVQVLDDCNSNGVRDDWDIANGTSEDCNSNGVPDECDLASGTSADCNSNGSLDECDVASGAAEDCQPNGTLDECELASGSSEDCNLNDTPDDCEPGGSEDCNTNSTSDLCDIFLGSSEDCQPNFVPDECDMSVGTSADCNSNGSPDECDIAGGSEDCQPNGVPDECETDCNDNSVPDDCDIEGGASLDCQPNFVPDECDMFVGTSQDCNSNGSPDECDIAGGSEDCQPNGVPDECELAGNDCDTNGAPDECDPDCNTNGVADQCDMDAGTSQDCNTNGRPDECDVASCAGVWDGFPMNDPPDPFQYNQPLSEIDYNGDGIYWDNPASTAVIDLYGCNVYPADRFDFSVRVSVPASGNPEDGYVASEYFETESGELGPEADVCSLSFSPRVQGVSGDTEFNHKYDWQYFIYDAASGGVVVQIEFVSSESTRVPTSQRGKILVKDPEGGYYDTGVPLVFQEEAGRTWTRCFDIEAMLDNRDGSVKVYVDGELKVETTRLHSNARRMDYFHLQAVGNLASTSGDTSFRLDRLDLCLTGRAVSPGVYDCNGNGVLDECDITSGTSVDCNANGIPDECEMGDFDDDGDVGLSDYQTFQSCFTGPDGGPLDAGCDLGDFDCDDDIDLADFAAFQEAFTG